MSLTSHEERNAKRATENVPALLHGLFATHGTGGVIGAAAAKRFAPQAFVFPGASHSSFATLDVDPRKPDKMTTPRANIHGLAPGQSLPLHGSTLFGVGHQ